MDLLQTYISLLKNYNEKTNIFSKKAYDTLDFHINDCFTLSTLLPNTPCILFDFGSGSGLPSIPLAIYKKNIKIYAIESKSRKTIFLNEIKKSLNLTNFTVINKNLFEWEPPCKPDIITAKAFAPLEKINRLYNKFKHKNTIALIPISSIQAENYKKEPYVTIIEKNNYTYAKISSNP